MFQMEAQQTVQTREVLEPTQEGFLVILHQEAQQTATVTTHLDRIFSDLTELEQKQIATRRRHGMTLTQKVIS